MTTTHTKHAILYLYIVLIGCVTDWCKKNPTASSNNNSYSLTLHNKPKLGPMPSKDLCHMQIRNSYLSHILKQPDLTIFTYDFP